MYNLVYGIGLFESLVPQPELRQACLNIFADAIIAAHAQKKWVWRLNSLHQLYVGKTSVYERWETSLILHLHTDALSGEAKNAANSLRPDWKFRVPKGAVSVAVPFEKLCDLWPILKESFILFVENTAKASQVAYPPPLYLNEIYVKRSLTAGDIRNLERFTDTLNLILFLRAYLNRPVLNEEPSLNEEVVAPIRQKLGLTPFRPKESEPIQEQRISWRIFPPGEHPFAEVIKHCEEFQHKNPEIRFDLERLRRIHELSPTTIYRGIDEFDGYFVFYFQDHETAILDCPVVGNAVYIIRGQWEGLSKLSKAELLKNHAQDVSRVVHSGNWFSRLKTMLASPKRV